MKLREQRPHRVEPRCLEFGFTHEFASIARILDVLVYRDKMLDRTAQ